MAAGLLALVAHAGAAEAGCTRRIYNRSALTLVGSQDGGPAFVLPPGRSMPIRLTRPGTFDLGVSCAPLGQFGYEGRTGSYAAQAQLSYQAVIDRCYIKVGDQLLRPEFGPGSLGMQSTAPFTVNNPRQGDIVLGPSAGLCAPQAF